MKHSLGLTLALSATIFFISACSNTPYEDPTESGSASNIPEAGPLTSGGGGGYGGGYTQQPQQGGGTYYPPQTTTPPQQSGGYVQQPQQNGSNSYDSYAGGNADGYDQNQPGDSYDTAGTTNNAAGNAGGGYDYSGGNNNDSYDSYGSNTGSGNTGNTGAGNDYYAGGSAGGAGVDNSGGGNDYYAGGGNGGGSIGSSSGRAAVQIFASGSSSKAQQVRSSMASRGLNAVVDSVDGLYKVRVPFGTESEARSNLIRVRSASGESGAFVTFR
ncbi:MAG: SPOR domain-containing protein [Thiolinea sp.]